MTANAVTTHPVGLAGRTASSVADARTPFYNHLMTMIDATALENRRASQDQETTGVLLVVGQTSADPGWINPGWRIGHLLTCAAGVVAAIAVVGAVVGSVSRLREGPVAAAESASDRTALVAAGLGTADKPTETPASAPAGGLQPTASKGEATTGSGGETATVPASKPGAAPDAKHLVSPEPTVAARLESEGVKTISVKTVNVGARADTANLEVAPPTTPSPSTLPPPTPAPSTMETRVETVAPAETKAAKQPQPADAPAPSAPSIETGSIETGAEDKASAPTRIARIVSDVRMRAGPGNGEAVLATLPRGRDVEVVSCRAWCEVIADGQRGWVYKGFVSAPQSP